MWKLVRGHWKTGFHALPEGSELRETIDRLILQRIRAPAWQDLLNGYMPD